MVLIKPGQFVVSSHNTNAIILRTADHREKQGCVPVGGAGTFAMEIAVSPAMLQ
jgi:hypothetical protein